MRSRRSKWRKDRLALAAKVREMERILHPPDPNAVLHRLWGTAASKLMGRAMREVLERKMFEILKNQIGEKK